MACLFHSEILPIRVTDTLISDTYLQCSCQPYNLQKDHMACDVGRLSAYLLSTLSTAVFSLCLDIHFVTACLVKYAVVWRSIEVRTLWLFGCCAQWAASDRSDGNGRSDVNDRSALDGRSLDIARKSWRWQKSWHRRSFISSKNAGHGRRAGGGRSPGRTRIRGGSGRSEYNICCLFCHKVCFGENWPFHWPHGYFSSVQI